MSVQLYSSTRNEGAQQGSMGQAAVVVLYDPMIALMWWCIVRVLSSTGILLYTAGFHPYNWHGNCTLISQVVIATCAR